MAKPPRPAAAAVMLTALLWLETAAATWCVARSDASDQALQMALDYACSAGADCVPLQSNGLCYLPNTLLAHASYAFNSYYQRKAMAPGSCEFSGTATVAKTDPSYGSCVYPASLSTAGGATTTTTPITNPMTPTGGYNPGGTTPMTPMSASPLIGDGSSNGLNNPAGSMPLTPSDDSSSANTSKWDCKGYLACMMMMVVIVHMLVGFSLLGHLWVV